MKKRLLYLFTAILLITSTTFSQSPDFIEWFTLGDGFNTTANAVAVNGNDVYVGGNFVLTGGVQVNHIAKWNGTEWSSLGSGLNGEVTSIAIIGDDVYAAGFFSMAGSVPVNNIAKWDGTNWSALGSGVNELVLALAVKGTHLYAGGFFTEAGGNPANRIAKWDGSSWSALGTGINNEVNAIAVKGDTIYAGGIFTEAGGVPVSGLAMWDGSNWFDVGGGVNGIARALEVVDNDLYIGGVFTMAGGSVPGRIVRWDGSNFHTLDTGVNGSVFSIEQSGNDLYVGGMFTTAGGQTANRIAKFNMVTSSWSPVGDGANSHIDAMAVQGTTNSMIIAGSFSQVGNGLVVNYVARFTDSENPLPIELNSFTASVNGNDVTLSWITSTETNNSGFEILRSEMSNVRRETNFLKVGFVDGGGTTTELQSYSFVDDNLSAGSYNYRIKQIDFDGSFKYYALAETIEIGTPDEFVLEQNYPNPFNPSTKIKYTIPTSPLSLGEGLGVRLTVYDVLGNEVAILVDEYKSAGNYEVNFSTEAIRRITPSSGIYFYTLTAGDYKQTMKMILLK